MGIFFKLNFPSKSVAVATELFSICTVAPIIASPLFLSLTSAAKVKAKDYENMTAI